MAVIKLTSAQREILEELAKGAMLAFNEFGQLCLPTPLPGRNSGALQHVTRDFMMKNRLIERFDKTKDARTKGNGYIISAKGRSLLE